MSEIRVGDRVRINKPKDVRAWPTWVSEMDKFDGRVMKIERIGNSAFGKGRYTYFEEDNQWFQFDLKWCEKVEEEMALAQWEKMSPQERLEWNRPAFEALADESKEVQRCIGDKAWVEDRAVDIITPYRVKPESKSPPKEVWFGVDNKSGEIQTVAFHTEEEAEEWKADRVDEYRALVVKYVIAE